MVLKLEGWEIFHSSRYDYFHYDVFRYLKIARPNMEAANAERAKNSLKISAKLDPFKSTLRIIFTK